MSCAQQRPGPGTLQQHSLMDNPGDRRPCHQGPNPLAAFIPWGWLGERGRRKEPGLPRSSPSAQHDQALRCGLCTWTPHSDLLVVQVTQDQVSLTNGSGGACAGNQSSVLEQSILYPQRTFPFHAAIPSHAALRNWQGRLNPMSDDTGKARRLCLPLKPLTSHPSHIAKKRRNCL